MSLFARLFLLLLLVGVAPVLPTGALLFYYQNRAKDDVLNMHSALSSMTAEAVRQHMGGVTARMAFADQADALITKNDRHGLENLFKSAMSSNPDFLLTALLDENGDEVLKVGTPAMLRRYGVLDRGSDPVFLAAKRNGRVVFSNFESEAGVPVAAMVFPLKGGKCLFIILNFGEMWNSISAQAVGSTGRVYLADAYGRVFSFEGQPAPDTAPSGVRALFVDTHSKIRSLPATGGDMVGAFSKVPDVNLYVLVLQRESEAFWVLRVLGSVVVFIFLFTITAGYFAALYYARRLGGPIEALIRGAERASNGDFDKPVPETGWGEFSGLLSSFNKMMSALKHYRDVKADEQLEEKRKMDLLFSLMHEGVVLATLEGEPLFLNPAGQRFLSEQAQRHSFPGDHAQRAAAVMRDIIARAREGSDWQSSTEPRMPGPRDTARRTIRVAVGGEKRYYRVDTEFFLPRRGDRLILAIIRDVTLERQLDAMKEEFFSSVAHDLRAPLIGIQGYIALMAHSCAGMPQQKEYISAMESSTEKLMRLVEDILDIGRMESGSVHVNPQDLDFRDFAFKTSIQFEPVIENRKIKFSINAPEGAQLRADARFMERVLANLLSNAFKFTPEGGAVTVDFLPEGGFSVSDTGPGIPQEKLSSIFRKYSQLESGKEKGGYGLGLSIARKIVELHGGGISVREAQGGGACFEVRVPSSGRIGS